MTLDARMPIAFRVSSGLRRRLIGGCNENVHQCPERRPTALSVLKATPSLAAQDTPHILVHFTEPVRIFAVSDWEQCAVVNTQLSCCVQLASLAIVVVVVFLMAGV